MFNFKNKTMLIAITLLIAASLSLGNFFSDNMGDVAFSNDNIGWSGNKPIKNIDFLRYKEFLSIDNPNISNKEIVKKIGERYSILQYAENQLNIIIPKDMIINKIKSNKIFQVNGVFDELTYFNHIKQTNLTPEDYEKNIRENLQLEKLIQLTDIRNNSKKSSKLMAESLMQILNIDLYEMNYTYQDDIVFKDDDIKNYYENNTEEFKTDLNYTVEISKYIRNEDYLLKKWNENKEKAENVYDIKQILLNTKEDLDNILNKVDSETFENLALKYSIDATSSKNGGLIKGLKEKELTPDFLEGLKKSKIGGIFATKSALGFHLVKKEKMISSDINFEDFKNYYEFELKDSFIDDVKNKSLKPLKKEIITISNTSLKSIFDESTIDIGDEKIIGENETLEKVKILKKDEIRNLNIKNEIDYNSIKNIYQNKLKLKNSIILSFNIEEEFNKNSNWIMKSNIDINKNSEIPQVLKDVIFTTKIGQKGDLVFGNKYFVFVVKKEKQFKTKEEDFKKLINSMYNFESGIVLIEEAKSLYPIRISKKLIN